ncbi:hypothetical protein N7G274_007533 [Stereocaulon virgatum]|uniref:Protein kinase domain-containing protein n=1 Tax=Stereocaulon virgatum TaxID=373712 RepID=A0ABR4A133_9LECA
MRSMEIAHAWKRELQERCYITCEGEHFIPLNELRELWNDERLVRFFSTIWADQNIECEPCRLITGIREYPKDGTLQLISILIWSLYPAWHHFHDVYCPIFLQDPDHWPFYWTLGLPHNALFDKEVAPRKILWNIDEAALDMSSHSREWFIKKFYEAQYIFTPLCLQEGGLDNLREKRVVLPLLWRDDEIKGKGAAGTVIDVFIPEYSLQTRDDHKKYIVSLEQHNFGGSSSRFHKVACKRIDSRRKASLQMGELELKNLDLIRRRHLHHLNIAQSIAAISTTLPSQIFILFELAICDLEFFIQRQGAVGIGPLSCIPLLEQMYWLCDALLFIHESLGRHVDATKSNMAFCHLDIKPANILIYKSEEIPRYARDVGTWKMTDFGIAGENELRPISKRGGNTTWTLTDSHHMTGMFSAPEHFHPEMKVGRSADVWSLGCVMFLVTMLGYAPNTLEKMYRKDDGGLMARSTNDTSNATNDRFYRLSDHSDEPLSGERNPHVTAWLQKAEKECQGKCDEPLFGLIRDEMLCKDPRKRVEMSGVLARLHPILKDLRQEDHGITTKRFNSRWEIGPF